MFITLRQTVSLLIGLILFAGCAPTSTLVNVPTRSGPAIESPVYKAGDSWVFKVRRDGDIPEELRVSYKNNQFEANNSEIWSGSVWATVVRNDLDIKALDFPLNPGKTWAYRYRGGGGRGRTFWRDAEVKVIGPTAQPVKTAAGQFKAVEIQRYENWGRAERKTTYFYSPETKSVVKLVSDISSPSGQRHYEMDLVNYSAGK